MIQVLIIIIKLAYDLINDLLINNIQFPYLNKQKMTFSPEFYKSIQRMHPSDIGKAIQGGITIALAASLYYSFFGFILGVSGLVGNVIRGKKNYDARRSFTVICGLVFSSAMVYYMYNLKLTEFYPFDLSIQGTNTHLLVSGILVGVGTQLGSGCTSGHGLCGLPRLSIRSIFAVLIFLITGIITATFNISNLIPSLPQLQNLKLPLNINPLYYFAATVTLPFVLFFLSKRRNFNRFFRTIIYFFIGAIFGFGLMLAGMSQRQKIYGFLELNQNWDPSLIFVLMSGVLVNLVIFTIMRKGVKKTFFESVDGLSDPKGQIDWKLIIGSFLFGLGWGIGGLCPGPFLLLIPLHSLRIPIFWGVPFIIGMKISQVLNSGKGARKAAQEKPKSQ